MTEELEQDLRDLRLAEQAILKEALEERGVRLKDLEAEVTYLRRLLNELTAVPRLTPAPALATAAPRRRPVEMPRRWRA